MNTLLIVVMTVASVLMGIVTHLYFKAVDKRNELKGREFIVSQFIKNKRDYMKMDNHCSHTKENFPTEFQEIITAVTLTKKMESSS